MAPHSSTLAWRIPWTEEPGGLQSMRLQGKESGKVLVSKGSSGKAYTQKLHTKL